MTDYVRVETHLRYGEKGDYVINDKTHRKVVRADGFINTLPHCDLFENGVFLRNASFMETMNFIMAS